MKVKRERYLSRLIARKHDGLVKIVTGIRRCGKSFLLFNLFREHLISCGVDSNHIIGMPMAVMEEDDAARAEYLKSLFSKVYIQDMVERNHLRTAALCFSTSASTSIPL